MSSFIAANPVISSGSAQTFEIFEGIIHNLLVTGNLTSTANIGDVQDLVVSYIRSNVAIINQLTSSIANISQLTANIANIRHLTADIANINQLTSNTGDVSFLNAGVANVGVMNAINVSVGGNVVADYFIGNGTQLTGISTNVNVHVTTDKYLLANVIQSDIYLSANAVNSPGMLTALNSSGKIDQQSLDGYLVTPEGYVANAIVRLGLGGGDLPIGSVVRQTDNGNSYMLTASPSNIDVNWITFTGVIFPVNTVFGRIGDVLATYGDYLDNYVELSESVGVVPAGNAVSEALTMLQDTKKDRINRQSMWVTNGSQSISNTTTIPISFGSFRTTGASNATIISMSAGSVPSAMFKNTGGDNLFAISTRVTFGNVANNGESTVVMSMNGNISSVNRLAESYQTSVTPHLHTQIHSLSSTVFIPSGEFVEILATVDNNTACSVDGLLSFSQLN
jgi:hypothetical protein